MPRTIHTNENLDGLTLDASLQLDGHARQSYFGQCSINGTIFLGDWRGSDFLACTGAANWSGAQTYACHWRANSLQGSIFPSDVGWAHHQVVHEIYRAKLSEYSLALRTKVQAILTQIANPDASSWDTTKSIWWDALTPAQRNAIANVSRTKVLASYPKLLERHLRMERDFAAGISQPTPPMVATVLWGFDGVTVTVDGLNLPSLSRPLDRYELARWIETQAGPGHLCFVYSCRPPIVRAFHVPEPDSWLTHAWNDF